MMKAQESMRNSHMANIAIKLENLSKCYQIYGRPQDHLLQMLVHGRKQ